LQVPALGGAQLGDYPCEVDERDQQHQESA
jgi:hypothetical protein